jgi:hypothetical protein
VFKAFFVCVKGLGIAKPVRDISHGIENGYKQGWSKSSTSLIVDLADSGAGNVGVELRGGDIGVSKQFLDDSQIGSAF